MATKKLTKKAKGKPYKQNFVGWVAVDMNALRLREHEEKCAPWLELQKQLPDSLRGDLGGRK